MFKALPGIVVVSALLSLAPANAAEMDCNEANMMKANGDMDKMAAGEKKTMGMKEMTMGQGDDGQEGHGRVQNAYE